MKKTIIKGVIGKEKTLLPSRCLKKQIFCLQSRISDNFCLLFEYVSFNDSERAVTHIQWDFCNQTSREILELLSDLQCKHIETFLNIHESNNFTLTNTFLVSDLYYQHL